ncbi:hypothetical protein [Micromonospora okii]|uniref:hypothetical protein n=1 Tax=Micromonospora okii TaxID=1182970 RepID=UPI001E4BB637|nr:hypothetical protein [Micromonospora okii]
MRPTIAAETLRRILTRYLTTTFGLTEDGVHRGIEGFLSHPEQGIFRGPYLRIRTPFRLAEGDRRAGLDWAPVGFIPGCTRRRPSPGCRPRAARPSSLDRLHAGDIAPLSGPKHAMSAALRLCLPADACGRAGFPLAVSPQVNWMA